MKRILVILGLLFVLNSCVVYAADELPQDMDQLRSVIEVGALANDSKYDKALEKCNEALKKYPNNPDLYYWKSSIYLNKNDANSALKFVQKAIAMNTEDSTYYVLRGSIYSNMNKHDLSMKDFDKAVEIDPKNPVTYIIRAGEKVSVGDFTGADSDFKEAKKLQEESENSPIKDKKSLIQPITE